MPSSVVCQLHGLLLTTFKPWLFHVVSAYQKGDPSQLDNCRPISLLNACYELRAALSRERLDKGLDNTIPSTQYGSHNSKSTAQTIYIARRLQD